MLHISKLDKYFDNLHALNDVNFDAKDGRILGLIGQNGAGKSTTFHSILDFIKYNGEITWNNKHINEKSFDEIGYLPEERSLMEKATVQQQIIYFAKLKNRKTSWTKPRIKDWMKKFDVKGDLNSKLKSLSKGNQQKIQLICTLIHEPKLIILDEPFSGLDPVNADLLKQSILAAKDNGATIIFSSHNMNNVEEICDDLVMLKNGEVVLNGSVQEVRNRFGKNELYVTTPMPKEELKQLPGVESVIIRDNEKYKLRLSNPDAGIELFKLISKGEYIEEFSQQPPSLDEIFREKVGETNE
ncbi:ATP-binding cassette domain-containing protein [Apilactobacillus timberlakei]|uniref:ABC transporter ATP-binding protein n=1 Tax=Apilactobacillus timberlakei TaxID=2008380 RepID=UPI00112D4F44|nr:ATP-binding cassette domain-containing protein [Apilactobacillus timberlakei]TPR17663.1 ATP-binding cassette domain-containing protein [Apilactobacillus timberlakei]TPR19476.1 ATP-binding cassette domain-containing protein [Apilactobacillus timberlakei]TPR20854.1 ATP-binding cassette domain-containing protein [Apilactobacillus timberlakei]